MEIQAISDMVQYVSLSPSLISSIIGTEFVISVSYQATEKTTGLGLRIHYDSSIIEFFEVENISTCKGKEPAIQNSKCWEAMNTYPVSNSTMR